MKKRILITGGHLSPALAVIEELKKSGHWQISFVGRKYPLEGDKALSLEYQTIKKLGLPFLELKTGRLQRRFTRFTISSLLKIPLGFLQALFFVSKVRPDVILSFGGYIAFPIVVAAWLFKTVVVTHEQTMSPGLANRLIGYFSQKICVSWPENVKNFPKEKVVLTGNPIRKEVFNHKSFALLRKRKEHLGWWRGSDLDSSEVKSVFDTTNENLPLIYITGGSLGAHAINEVVMEILPQLLAKYRVIHQCGDSTVYQDFEKLQATRYKLQVKLRKRYYLTKFIGLEDIGWVLHKADFVVSRAGANTITELLALGKPAILIPLPWAGGGEQAKNAQILKKLGSAEILPQEKLTPQTFFQCFETLKENIDEYKKNAEKGKKLIKLDATEKIVDILEEIVI